MSVLVNSRGLLALTAFAVFLDAAAVAWVVHAAYADRAALLRIRAALFTEIVEDRSSFELGPENQSSRFMADSEISKTAWREQSRREVEYVDRILSLEGSATERAKAMVPIFSRNGGTKICGGFRDLTDTLQRIGTDDGYGCCSDHSVSFLALASISGLAAREMIHADHVFAEFYDPDAGQWVWIDPQFALMARTESGRYLSLLELRDRYLEDRPPVFEFIGNEYHDLLGRDPSRHHYYDEASDFAVYSATWGSNVFEQDDFNRRFEFLPIPVRQLLGLITGQLPGFRTLSDGYSEWPEVLRRKRVEVFGALALLAVVNLAVPIWILAARAGRPLPVPKQAANGVRERKF